VVFLARLAATYMNMLADNSLFENIYLKTSYLEWDASSAWPIEVSNLYLYFDNLISDTFTANAICAENWHPLLLPTYEYNAFTFEIVVTPLAGSKYPLKYPIR
jgi:hypothetical protein